MKKVLSIIYAIIVLGTVGCQEEDFIQVDSNVSNKCAVCMEATIDMYDQTTRSSSNTIKWENGTKLFLNFSNDGAPITGVAEYDAEEDIWMLSYTGNLSLANKVEVSVYYFTEYEIDSSGKNVLLSHKSAIYSDTNGVYSFLSDGELRIAAHLTPAIGRIRFKGNPGDELTINGISTNYKCDISTNEVKHNDCELNLFVEEDGYTPYVYGIICDIDNALVLYHKYCRYEKLCDTNVLKRGNSGFMNIPTQENHIGWELIPLSPTIETISPTNVYDEATLNGRILSNGGNEIIEYGFLYGTDLSELQEYKSTGSNMADFSYTIPVSGDSTYYYQAYAVNSIGKSFGEVIDFTPPSNIPTITTVKVSNISHITGAKYKCTFYGKISDLNNSSLLDYGFIIDREVGWYSQTQFYSIPSKCTYGGFYGNTNTEAIEVQTPYEFSYTLTFESDTDYPVLMIRAYARNGKGMAIGDMIVEDDIW